MKFDYVTSCTDVCYRIILLSYGMGYVLLPEALDCTSFSGVTAVRIATMTNKKTYNLI
jgi:hypothetical protein